MNTIPAATFPLNNLNENSNTRLKILTPCFVVKDQVITIQMTIFEEKKKWQKNPKLYFTKVMMES
jgi:hypothetical protein